MKVHLNFLALFLFIVCSVLPCCARETEFIFVNNSIDVPGSDSIVRWEVFSSDPVSVLDDDLSSEIDYVSGAIICRNWLQFRSLHRCS
jgi:hypothetical protein